MKFSFPDANFKKFATSLSALVRIGDDLWVGGDEGVRIERFRETGKEAYTMVPDGGADVRELLQLPDESGAEVDLEGMDWDEDGGYLWLVGSHSRKRDAAKFKAKDADGKRCGSPGRRPERPIFPGDRAVFCHDEITRPFLSRQSDRAPGLHPVRDRRPPIRR